MSREFLVMTANDGVMGTLKQIYVDEVESLDPNPPEESESIRGWPRRIGSSTFSTSRCRRAPISPLSAPLGPSGPHLRRAGGLRCHFHQMLTQRESSLSGPPNDRLPAPSHTISPRSAQRRGLINRVWFYRGRETQASQSGERRETSGDE
ncbi:unnamed protein product [Pleuronectes platessa]|uniref:Uncharacterized protein n=1 Tax=Pleuronectes platessa TaxID=8262 RepID=A0A9N7UDK8_PLEPL|nr:unnamed protein product [Pleuronectes platessa]